MELHYMTEEEFDSLPKEVRFGYAGWGQDNVSLFRRRCKDVICADFHTKPDEQDKIKCIAETLLNGIIPDGIKKRVAGTISTFDMWYEFDLNGTRISFGLNTRIPCDIIDKIEWI